LFGAVIDGRVVELITLHNAQGITVRFSTWGGS
jgi:hypothetical protein